MSISKGVIIDSDAPRDNFPPGVHPMEVYLREKAVCYTFVPHDKKTYCSLPLINKAMWERVVKPELSRIAGNLNCRLISVRDPHSGIVRFRCDHPKENKKEK